MILRIIIIYLLASIHSFYYMQVRGTLCPVLPHSLCVGGGSPGAEGAVRGHFILLCLRLSSVTSSRGHFSTGVGDVGGSELCSLSSPSPSTHGEVLGPRRKLYSAVPGRHFVVVRPYTAQAEGEINLYKGDRVKGESGQHARL